MIPSEDKSFSYSEHNHFTGKDTGYEQRGLFSTWKRNTYISTIVMTQTTQNEAMNINNILPQKVVDLNGQVSFRTQNT